MIKLIFFFFIFRAKWVITDGMELKVGTAVVTKASTDEELVHVATILSIYIINGDTVVLKGECYSATYKPHFRAYTLQSQNQQSLLYYTELPLHIPLHVRSPRVLPHHSVILLPYYIY